MGVTAKKVKGVRKEESSALMRLADALCGFVRDAYEGDQECAALHSRAINSGYISQAE
jgi:hypothetical protein